MAAMVCLFQPLGIAGASSSSAYTAHYLPNGQGISCHGELCGWGAPQSCRVGQSQKSCLLLAGEQEGASWVVKATRRVSSTGHHLTRWRLD